MTNGDFIRLLPDNLLIKSISKWREDINPPWCPPVCINNYDCDKCLKEWITSDINDVRGIKNLK